MGHGYTATCTNCKYTQGISNSRRKMSVIAHKNYICKDCECIVELEVGTYQITGDVMTGTSTTFNKSTEPLYCKFCHNQNLIEWDGISCPKCSSQFGTPQNSIYFD
jgi:hypothetical protein